MLLAVVGCCRLLSVVVGRCRLLSVVVGCWCSVSVIGLCGGFVVVGWLASPAVGWRFGQWDC